MSLRRQKSVTESNPVESNKGENRSRAMDRSANTSPVPGLSSSTCTPDGTTGGGDGDSIFPTPEYSDPGHSDSENDPAPTTRDCRGRGLAVDRHQRHGPERHRATSERTLRSSRHRESPQPTDPNAAALDPEGQSGTAPGPVPRRLSTPVQEMTGRAIPETGAPANAILARMYMNRDMLQDMIDNLNERIQIAERAEARRQALSLPSSNITLDDGNQIDAEFRENSMGSVVCIEKGSIVLKIRMTSANQLRNFLVKRRDGSLKSILTKWLAGPVKEEISDLQLVVGEEQFKRVKDYYARDCLAGKVDFTFCPVSCLWLWTADRNVWHKIDEIVVREGPDKGKRPQKADLHMFEKLSKMDPQLFIQAGLQSSCAICANLSELQHPETLGNIETIEVDIRIIYTSAQPTASKNNSTPIKSSTERHRPTKRPSSLKDMEEDLLELISLSPTPKLMRPVMGTCRARHLKAGRSSLDTSTSIPRYAFGGTSDGEDLSPSCSSSQDPLSQK